MQWVMAATLFISDLTVFTSCSVDDNPVKREPKMMLVGLEFTNIYYFGRVMEKYTYDADYRLVNMKIVQVSTGDVLSDLDYIYTPGHITKKGQDYFHDVTDECRLDDQGRIVEQRHNTVDIETGKASEEDLYTFTYDENGHLATMQLSDLMETYIWEGDELRAKTVTSKSAYGTYDYETSDAPAQAVFNRFGYSLPELCQQGCFGVLPAHLPAKETFASYVDGTLLFKIVEEYNYTTADGRLATFSLDYGTYILHWEQK
jgi:hypothetical protein